MIGSINGFLTEDLGRLDKLLEGLQERRVKAPARARALLAELVQALHRHRTAREARTD